MKHGERVVVTGWGFYGTDPEGGVLESAKNGATAKDKAGTFYAKADTPDTKVLLPGISTRLTDRQSIFAGIAAGRAASRYLAGAGIDRTKTGVALGSTFGSIVSILRFHRCILTEGGNFVNPTEFPNVVSNAAASRLGIWYGLKGHCIALSDGLASGLDAVGFAYDDIRRGKMEHYLAGDTEEFSEELQEAYVRIAGDRPGFSTGEGLCREMLCEGAGVLLLSGHETAKACKMDILGEITGYVNTAYRKEAYIPEKVIDSVVNYFAEIGKAETDSFVFFSALHPLSRMSELLAKEAEKRFGRDSVHIDNRRQDALLNWFGLSGVMNIKSALDLPDCRYGNKAAIIMEAADDGKVSALSVKKYEEG